jgi:hypothetical protein
MCVKYMQHPNKHTCNIRLDKTDELLEKEACNIRVQPLQHMQHPGLNLQHGRKHLQHTSETSETLETYVCNMRFQRNISLLLRRIESRCCVDFTGGCGLGRGAENMAPTSSSRRQHMDLGTRAAGDPRLPPRVQEVGGPWLFGAQERKRGRHSRWAGRGSVMPGQSNEEAVWARGGASGRRSCGRRRGGKGRRPLSRKTVFF